MTDSITDQKIKRNLPSGKTEGSSNATKHRFSSMLSTSKNITNTSDCSFRSDGSDPSIDLALKNHSSGSLLITEVISIPVTSFTCFGRQPGYYADNDGRVSCKVKKSSSR